MSFFYRRVVRPVLFTQESERIHRRTLSTLAWLSQRRWLWGTLTFPWRASELPIKLFGLDFPNPVGLAAGMDKNAEALPMWELFGFGFCELGGVTWHPQPGNAAPRMFRAIRDEALINRMGFNNCGAEAMARKLADWRALGLWPQHPVGINLGKSKITPLENAAEDYANSFRALHEHADFFVVNVSSPNTPGLRQLQDKTALDEILAELQRMQSRWSLVTRHSSLGSANGSGGQNFPRGPGPTEHGPSTKPILVKVAPDLSFEALDEILELVGPREIAGIVATNTTITRPPTNDPRLQKIYAESGGLSGRPLKSRSTEVIRHLCRQSKGTVPIVGVGGIFNAEDAWEKIAAGASLVQVYSGLVYEGPGVARRIVAGLKERIAAAGHPSWPDLVGCAVLKKS